MQAVESRRTSPGSLIGMRTEEMRISMTSKRSISERTQDYLVNTRTIVNNVNKMTGDRRRIVDNINRNVLGIDDDE
jgi:hypothetical protein